MIAHVSRAEARLAKGRRNVFAPPALPKELASAAEIAPIIRGACAVQPAAADAEPRRFVLDFRTGPEILNYVNGADLARLQPARRGDARPHHPHQEPAADGAGAGGGQARRLRKAPCARRSPTTRRATMPCSRARTPASATARPSSTRCRAWCWCRASACSASAPRAKDAAIAADLAENAVQVITDAEAIGRFEPLPEADLFDVEYWSLEQAKLKGAVAKPFTGQVAVVTGAGSGIGLATAKAFAAEGAAVAVLDLDEAAAEAAAKEVGGLGACLRRDRSRQRARRLRRASPSASAASTSSCRTRARPGRAGSARCRDEVLRQSFELNFFAHQAVAQEAVAIMLQAGHRRRAAVQRLQAGGEPGPRFRALRPAQGGDAGADAPVRRRLRRRGHPRQRRQRRPHPHRPADRRHGRQALQGARA